MKLSQLSKAIKCVEHNFVDVELNGIEIDSRKIKNGNIYVCIDGFSVDGHAYASSAIENGAIALITQRILPDISVPQLVVESSRSALSICAGLWHNNPSKKLKIIGITGTNGKTTTSHMVKKILDANNVKAATIGTIGTYINDEVYNQSLTTPDPMELQEIFSVAVKKGCEIVIMEVSAHALELNKVDGMEFYASAFTNLTQDHLDDFVTMERYKNAKKKLFTDISKRAIINIDDKQHDGMISDYKGKMFTYSTLRDADFFAEDVKLGLDSISYDLEFPDKIKENLKINIPGLFNAYNSLAAIAIAWELGLTRSEILKGVKNISNVDGRMELVDIGAPFKVIVDYAHTPDSLENLLVTVKDFCENNCICVFGCGGDRDNTKREIMGELAGHYADYSIVTSDNPRTEDPDKIIDMIETGIKRISNRYERITDRKNAIHKALEIAKKGDIVVIAGKGHETYQDIMGTKHHFDDREIVIEYMDK